MGKKRSRMEPRPQHQNQDMRNSGKTKKEMGRWEDEIKDFLKQEETEATKGNDIKNNDTCIWVTKQKDKWKKEEDEFGAASKKEESGTLLEQRQFSSSKTPRTAGSRMDSFASPGLETTRCACEMCEASSRNFFLLSICHKRNAPTFLVCTGLSPSILHNIPRCAFFSTTAYHCHFVHGLSPFATRIWL